MTPPGWKVGARDPPEHPPGVFLALGPCMDGTGDDPQGSPGCAMLSASGCWDLGRGGPGPTSTGLPAPPRLLVMIFF